MGFFLTKYSIDFIYTLFRSHTAKRGRGGRGGACGSRGRGRGRRGAERGRGGRTGTASNKVFCNGHGQVYSDGSTNSIFSTYAPLFPFPAAFEVASKYLLELERTLAPFTSCFSILSSTYLPSQCPAEPTPPAHGTSPLLLLCIPFHSDHVCLNPDCACNKHIYQWYITSLIILRTPALIPVYRYIYHMPYPQSPQIPQNPHLRKLILI